MKMPSFHRRSQQKEILDEITPDDREMAVIYRLMGGVNAWLGGCRTVIHHLERFADSWQAGGTVRILDVGCGGGDIPRAVAEWARQRKQNVRIAALDLSFPALRCAQRTLEGFPEITLVQGSVFDLPFSGHSFDYVISSMFFHHLGDDEIVRILRIFDRIAGRGIIINDLLRRRRAWLGIQALGFLSGCRIFRHDGALSVLRGFRKAEVESLAAGAGLSYLGFYPHYAHRFALAGEKHA